VRFLSALPLTLGVVLTAPTASAETPDPARAVFAGAFLFVAGFTAGGLIVATSNGSNVQNNVGWLTIEGAFAAAPLVAHGFAEEWTRAIVFAAPPAAALGGTAGLFAMSPGTIEHGSLEEQRVLWALFGVGLLSSGVGVIDSAFADKRAKSIAIAPLFGPGQVGLRIGVML
jgi:hypothetical protein